MNGAESLVRTLLAAGVDTCFANPGTSELHFVSALDRIPGVRCVLGLFEGVATGAADGYFRMADRPAATLLHLGPGLANGLANLHNARRARSSILNVVGEHATYHKHVDAPLNSDIESLARPMSAWVRTTRDARSVGADAAEALDVVRSPKGQIATLILPADAAWNEGAVVGAPSPPRAPRAVSQDVVQEVADALRAGAGMLLLGGRALRAGPLALAASIGVKLGIPVASLSRMPRIERGAGRVVIDRIPNPVENAVGRFASLKTLVLIDETPPVAFFAHPGKRSTLTPDGCRVLTLAAAGDDIVAALVALAGTLDVPRDAAPVQSLARPEAARGELDLDRIAQSLGALLPEHAIVCDESITSGRNFFPATAGAPPHDWLQLTGGSIGLGIPMATGAAIAAPGRRVLNLEADGSGLYTLQGLWTQARERLDVTTVIWANRSYRILHNELRNVGAGEAGVTARRMLDLDDPAPDWVALAKGMGVEGTRVTTMEAFNDALSASFRRAGPFLVEVML